MSSHSFRLQRPPPAQKLSLTPVASILQEVDARICAGEYQQASASSGRPTSSSPLGLPLDVFSGPNGQPRGSLYLLCQLSGCDRSPDLCFAIPAQERLNCKTVHDNMTYFKYASTNTKNGPIQVATDIPPHLTYVVEFAPEPELRILPGPGFMLKDLFYQRSKLQGALEIPFAGFRASFATVHIVLYGEYEYFKIPIRCQHGHMTKFTLALMIAAYLMENTVIPRGNIASLALLKVATGDAMDAKKLNLHVQLTINPPRKPVQ